MDDDDEEEESAATDNIQRVDGDDVDDDFHGLVDVGENTKAAISAVSTHMRPEGYGEVEEDPVVEKGTTCTRIVIV